MKDAARPANRGKFQDPDRTADDQPRARVALSDPRTLWFNTGTRCNIACTHCYIESSPANDRLAYITAAEVATFLDEAAARGWGLREVGFTGGEPFLNPEILAMLHDALARGHAALVLTNAMAPMMRPRVREGLTALQAAFGARLTLRVSLDHHAAARHDAERGAGAFAATLAGMDWLRDAGIAMSVAGRTIWGEAEDDARAGYARLFAARGYAIDAHDPAACVLFPEMDTSVEVPEITTACWDILGTRPEDVMCASARMVVKRRGADRPAVLSCTLLPYDAAFEMGATLAEAEGDVALNHPHCAKFCVLGGATCSG